MTKRLSTAKVTDIDKGLRHAHDIIHEALEAGPKRKRVTASYLKELAADLRATAASLDSIATSPFLGIEAEPHRALREPQTAIA